MYPFLGVAGVPEHKTGRKPAWALDLRGTPQGVPRAFLGVAGVAKHLFLMEKRWITNNLLALNTTKTHFLARKIILPQPPQAAPSVRFASLCR